MLLVEIDEIEIFDRCKMIFQGSGLDALDFIRRWGRFFAASQDLDVYDTSEEGDRDPLDMRDILEEIENLEPSYY